MASIITMSKTSINHSTFTGFDNPPCSVQQVSLPSKNQPSLSISSSPKVATPFIRTGFSTGSGFSALAHLWRDIQGSNHWEGLVQPLHPLLRQEVIRYGMFVETCYKAFDLDPNSKRYLNCKYGKNTVLKDVELGCSGYKVTKYIYATPGNNGARPGRWVGYIAVSSDAESKRIGRRDVIVTFRGTVTNHEWMTTLVSTLTPTRLDPNNPRPEVKVHSGFLSLYTSSEASTSKFGLESCREQLISEVTRIINMYKCEEMSISIAGHSMGSSLGLLFAYDVAELGLNKIGLNRVIPVTVFSFAGPRVGNFSFKARCDELGVKVLRIVNVNDPITKMPGFLFNENWNVLLGGMIYAHVGVELAIDFFEMHNPSCVHDLECYIRLLRIHEISIPRKYKEDEGFDSVSMAREFLSIAQNVDISYLRNTVSNVIKLVQSLRM